MKDLNIDSPDYVLGDNYEAKKSQLTEMQRGQPFLGNSYYRNNFVDFSAGGVHVEKRPIYPVYQLPFNGVSSYRNEFDTEK